MARAAQIYDFCNIFTNEYLTGSQLAVRDPSDFTSWGKEVSNSNVFGNDGFYGALVNLIGKITAIVKKFETNDRYTKKDIFEYGYYMEQYYVSQLPVASQNNSWIANTPSNLLNVTPNTIIKGRIYGKRATFEIDDKLYTYQINDAVRDAADFARIVELIYNAINTSKEIKVKEIRDTAIASAMASCIYHATYSGKATAFNVLKEYNNVHPESDRIATVVEAIWDPKFINWVGMFTSSIAEIISKNVSTLYNEAGAPTNSDGSLVMEVINFWDKIQKRYLESNTYHDDLVKLLDGKYSVVTEWQNPGNGLDIVTQSSINVKIPIDMTDDSASDLTTVEGSYIIAFLRDENKVGMTKLREKESTFHDPSNDTDSFFGKYEYGYYNAPNFNGVVFYLADDPAQG